jgi:hypothetical protein
VRYGIAELAGIIVEGAVDRFVGRPRDANPYSEHYAEQAWHSWDFGWREGDWYLECRGQEKARRWLEEASA